MKRHYSPKEIAQAIGVSESSLKRWVDAGRLEAVRTAGGHRRIPAREVARFVHNSDHRLLRPEALELPSFGGREETIDPDLLADNLFEALRAGNADRARSLVFGAYFLGHSVAALCDGPICEAMARIGKIWNHDRRGIYVEHRATDITIQLLMELRSMVSVGPPEDGEEDDRPCVGDDCPVAIGGAAPNDPSVLPSLMASTVLAEAGFRDHNFGPDLPLDCLSEAVEHYDPKLVWIACSSHLDDGLPCGTVVELGQMLQTRGATLVLGGRGVPVDLRSGEETVNYVDSMSELTGFVRGLLIAKA